jgi:ribosomal protein L21E
MTSFTVGDRVKIKLESADNFLLPERKFAKEGRIATIIAVPNPKFSVLSYRIRWDVKRAGSQPVLSSVNAKELEVAGG